ncbi:hypothetical protein A9Q86_04470 [Flavobacteriales bacterium 33_180_T64]|nr:hypothetical protein A9Q86_04470 [Flavobacteriales bacterium 33_180_T64]
MKTNYLLNLLLTASIFIIASQTLTAQVRIVEVNPTTNEVKIHNYGPTTVNVSSYWFCHLFAYSQLNGGTVLSGSLNLASGADVVVQSSTNFNATASDLGLYQSPSFGSSTAMLDFTQWGSGGNGRENVAVAKGIWTAGTFINATPPYEFTGTSTDLGVGFWDTLLSINDLDNTTRFNLYPNPTNSILNIETEHNETELLFQVFDLLGKQILNKTIDIQALSYLDVTDLNSGIYLIKISAGDKSETKRFIKN